MAKYIGITIGPISDTLNAASTPAALWFASSIFSDITRRLCEEILSENGFPDAKIISPFHEHKYRKYDGIGKYHDRIIFLTNQYSTEKMSSITAKVKRDTIEVFSEEVKENTILKEAEEFLEQYLQIHYICLDETKIKGNVLLAISPYLDIMELMKTFPVDNSRNLINKMLNGTKNSRNAYIKNSKLFTTIEEGDNQIRNRNGNIRTIEEIASCSRMVSQDGDDFKRSYYYAVVQADGDNMGRFLEGIDKDEQITRFSSACFQYDEAAANMIGEYGGMTIYAGGDDLLFLAPVVNEAQETVFSLCSRINQAFQKIIQEGGFADKIPTVSFGISIQYVKYPLYEALKNAGKLLFAVAKENDDTKNSMAIEVQKHSGQSVCVLVPNQEYEVYSKLVNATDTQQETIIHSLLYTLEKNRELLLVLDRQVKEKGIGFQDYQAAWFNFFDNPAQQAYQEYISRICAIYYHEFVKRDIRITIPESGLPVSYEDKHTRMMSLLYLLRIQKFLFEKGGGKMKYLVTLKPLEPYLFGTDTGFKYQGIENPGKSTYFIRSGDMPEQTTILGMLRYITLEQEHLLKSSFAYSIEERNMMNLCIGTDSFSFSAEKKQSFGNIKRVSPVFIIDEKGHYLVSTPYHVQKPEGENGEYRFMEMSGIPGTQENLETSAGRIKLPREYHAKAGHASGFFDLSDRTEAGDQLFSSVIASGNRKNDQAEMVEEGFFKKELKYLRDGCSFAVYVEADKLPGKTIAYMGHKKSAFLMMAQENREDDLEERVKAAFRGFAADGDTWFYAMSDVYLQKAMCHRQFCIVEEKQIRNLETVYGEQSQARRLKKSSRQYNLIQSGSVFYEKCPEFIYGNKAQYENCRQIGYNHIIELGGR